METKKYEYIDVMRGIAILLVIVNHTGQTFNLSKSLVRDICDFSQIGVQLFFVASALTLSLSMRSKGTSRREVTRFYFRRFFRIAPLYYVGIVLYFLLAQHEGAIAGVYARSYTPINVIANVLFIHDLYPPSLNSIVPGGWSIGCEMLFYAIFPLIFLHINTRRRVLTFIVVTVFANLVLQFALRWAFKEPLGSYVGSYRYFLITNQLPVFGCGMLLYFAITEATPRVRAPINLVLALGFLLLAFAAWHSSLRLSFAFIPTLAGFAFSYLGQYLSQVNLKNIVVSNISSIGRKSFSIYIFHFLFAFGVVPRLVLNFAPKHTTDPYLCLPAVVFVTVCTYAIALFTNKFIEETGIALGRKVTADYTA